MKNLICAVALSLAAASFCSAQETAGTTQIGIQAGPSLTSFNRKNNTFPHFQIDRDFRGAGGLSFVHQFNKLFLKSGLLYEDKGFKTDYLTTDANGNPSEGYTLKSHYHYLTLPVMFGINIKKTGFFLNGGAYVAWLAKQTYTTDAPDSYDNPDPHENRASSWKRLDYGVTGGLGYSYPVSSTLNLSAEVRHSIGLHNISKGPIGYKGTSTSLLLGIYHTLSNK